MGLGSPTVLPLVVPGEVGDGCPLLFPVLVPDGHLGTVPWERSLPKLIPSSEGWAKGLPGAPPRSQQGWWDLFGVERGGGQRHWWGLWLLIVASHPMGSSWSVPSPGQGHSAGNAPGVFPQCK